MGSSDHTELKWLRAGRAAVQVTAILPLVAGIIRLDVLFKWSSNITAVIIVKHYSACAFSLSINATLHRSGGDVRHLNLKMCF